VGGFITLVVVVLLAFGVLRGSDTIAVKSR